MLISFLRTIILYIFIAIALRLMGKRQIGEFQPSELVITILVSELAAVSMQNTETSLLAGIIPMFTLVCAEIFTSYLSLKSLRFRRFLNGNPCVIIKNGVIDTNILFQLRISIDEIMEELRLQSITNIADVECAIIETNGQLSCLQKTAQRTATVSDLGLNPSESGIPLVVISDGKLIDKALKSLDKDSIWLDALLKKHNVSLNNVFILTCDQYNNIFLQKRDS